MGNNGFSTTLKWCDVPVVDSSVSLAFIASQGWDGIGVWRAFSTKKKIMNWTWKWREILHLTNILGYESGKDPTAAVLMVSAVQNTAVCSTGEED